MALSEGEVNVGLDGVVERESCVLSCSLDLPVEWCSKKGG